MNIYDFDRTIYDGDSSFDFFMYCLKKHKKNLLKVPSVLLNGLLFRLKLEKKETFKSIVFSVIKNSKNLEEDIKDFWSSHEKYIKDFYIKQKQSDDIIISASPYFLLRPICEKLGVNLIATDVDTKTGKIIGRNCDSDEKKRRLNEMNILECDSFYSDSLSDLPLAQISKQAFLVSKKNVEKWEINV